MLASLDGWGLALTMKRASRTPLSALGTTDLMVDRIFEGGRRGNYGDDPLHKIVGVSIRGALESLGLAKALGWSC